MTCPNCKKSGKLVVFQTFQYYYCNNCKDEIKLEESPKFELIDDTKIHIEFDLVEEFERLIARDD